MPVSANTYLGLETLESYNVSLCGEYCNKKALCTGFNIFIERDPSLSLATNCTLPSSITNYKCTLWGSGVDTVSVTNFGQSRGDFQVVVTGFDGFEKPNNTTPPQKMQRRRLQSPQPPQHLPRYEILPGPHDPSVCAAYASAQNAANTKSSFWSQIFSFFTGGYNPLQCTFFNSYMLKKNGQPLGTYYGLYAQSYAGSAATYAPG
ncbi:hypothetical protein G7Y89_g21 [Cudoniella acicularis]|uniref:Apple domain-containing protein n=1 Tax=Cudoniella acicularis TaxID=354080 RepID=A0A8H4S0M0_9HELO|nr:hypothetical protein G7Y89_g21 [Cudoniella acicularis]